MSSMAIFGLMTLMINGLVNTSRFNNIGFMSANYGIKLEKRLDEMTGKVVRGAASTVPWNKIAAKKVVKKVAPKRVASVNKVAKTSKKTWKSSFIPLSFNKAGSKKKTINHKVAENTPAPAVKDSLDLTVSKFFHKKEIQGVSGSAVTYDGVIEEVSVNLPDGRNLSINTNERMVGNVFYYEDTNTNEMKSGMFYEVKPGTYMLTLTNDSMYQGARIELVTDASQVNTASNNGNWSNITAGEAAKKQQVDNKQYADQFQQNNQQNNSAGQGQNYGFDFSQSAQNI
jgi:hypothetical protein